MIRLIFAGTCAWSVCIVLILLFFAGAAKLDTPEANQPLDKRNGLPLQ